jgi:hypothetical protein
MRSLEKVVVGVRMEQPEQTTIRKSRLQNVFLEHFLDAPVGMMVILVFRRKTQQHEKAINISNTTLSSCLDVNRAIHLHRPLNFSKKLVNDTRHLTYCHCRTPNGMCSWRPFERLNHESGHGIFSLKPQTNLQINKKRVSLQNTITSRNPLTYLFEA